MLSPESSGGDGRRSTVSSMTKTDAMQVKRLDRSQLAAFDMEYVGDNKWVGIRACIDRDFADRPFSFLDIGGGNGLFADRVLEAYPNATGVVLDNAETLLPRNKDWGNRKRILCGGAEEIGELFADERFDIIFMNWLLHHLVSGSYRATTDNVRRLLQMGGTLLRPGGRISICENMYCGLLIDDLPGHLIYHLTSSRSLRPLTKRLGANTAGVGVCFRSRRAWSSLIRSAGLEAIEYTGWGPWTIPLAHKLLLHVGRIHGAHFWVEKVPSSEDASRG